MTMTANTFFTKVVIYYLAMFKANAQVITQTHPLASIQSLNIFDQGN